MQSNIKAKFTTYLAGAIEHATAKEMKTWREEIKDKLPSQDLLIYDPVAQESYKVGKASKDQVEYIKGLKQGGHWDKFFEEMWKIWFGSISQNTDIMQLLTNLRMRKHIDGNKPEDLQYWGDAEAVVRSDFIVVYLPKATKTIGTIYEVMLAFLFRIPIYLIVPDASKTETNSSLLFGIQISGGKVFYSVGECVKYIKEEHKIDIMTKEEVKKAEAKELENVEENKEEKR
jgi:hypothetical protein